MRTMFNRWGPPASLLAAAAVLLVTGWRDPATVVMSGLLLVLAGLLAPWIFPRSRTDATARQRARELAVPLIYWRPGCIYCLRLRLALGRTGNRAVWVDVSEDADASARVRAANGGDETVPTVFLHGSASVNPSPAWVRRELS